MHYRNNILPVCVVLAHLAGTTLAAPVVDCSTEDYETSDLVKRDAEAHVSMPHVVAGFDPQPSNSSSAEGGEEEHKTLLKRGLEKRTLWGTIKKALCGTSEIKKEASIMASSRQSNTGASQQDVILPESIYDDQEPMVEPGLNNADGSDVIVGNQDLNRSMFTLQRGQSIVPQNEGMNYQAGNSDQEPDLSDTEPPRIRRPTMRGNPYSNQRPVQPQVQSQPQNRPRPKLNPDGSIVGSEGSRIPVNASPKNVADAQLFQDLAQGVEPILEYPGMEESLALSRVTQPVTEESLAQSKSSQPVIEESLSQSKVSQPAGSDNNSDLAESIKFSLRGEDPENPFVPSENAQKFYSNPNYFKEEEGGGPQPTIQQQNTAPPENNPGWLRRFFGAKSGNTQPPIDATNAPIRSEPRPSPEIDYNPSYVVNPADALRGIYQQLNQEADRLAAANLDPEAQQRHQEALRRAENRLISPAEIRRQAELADKIWGPGEDPSTLEAIQPQGQEVIQPQGQGVIADPLLAQSQVTDSLLQSEIIDPLAQAQVRNFDPEAPQNVLEESTGSFVPIERDFLETAQIFPNPMEQAQIKQDPLAATQIRYSADRRIDPQNGVRAGENAADQNPPAITEYQSFEEDTSDFMNNSREIDDYVNLENENAPPFVEAQNNLAQAQILQGQGLGASVVNPGNNGNPNWNAATQAQWDNTGAN